MTQTTCVHSYNTYILSHNIHIIFITSEIFSLSNYLHLCQFMMLKWMRLSCLKLHRPASVFVCTGVRVHARHAIRAYQQMCFTRAGPPNTDVG